MTQKLKLLFHIGLLISLAINLNLFAKEKKPPEITFNQINEHFWVLHGGNGLGANVGMSVGKDGILLIDAMNIKTGKKLIKAIRTISDKPIKYVINTHQHRDHRGGNEELVKIGATVIYPNFLKYLSGSNTRYEGVKREIQFRDQMTLKFNNEIFNLYHVKSHTWNDVIVQVKNSNIVFTGDNHATNWGPNIGVRGMRSHRDVIDLVLSLSDEKTVVVPGHIALADKNHVIQYDQKVQQWFEYILTSSAKGHTPEQIANTAKIKALILWFHGGKHPDWLTKERFVARVSHTMFADEKSAISLSRSQLTPYTGIYRLKDGSQVEIFIHQDELHAFKDKTFTAMLLARSKKHFDFAGWNEQERIDFEFDSNDKPTQLTFRLNGKVEFSATRINNG
ncbi:MBL fold metallo-hydrolase [Aliikangiella coralliicola]|uniref:MBL fold metallo-hydrolase n=1 Tax=Aliikangiella coralliicola TaxID=2592383 RepID=A0A545UJD2_9GAMM|nr:MBL fold metallo-hydrolase [Aliikangiella coralliicola]TQV89574.1 MBL fold metallo-hydrolase [Aliikangiella coralliicola]